MESPVKEYICFVLHSLFMRKHIHNLRWHFLCTFLCISSPSTSLYKWLSLPYIYKWLPLRIYLYVLVCRPLECNRSISTFYLLVPNETNTHTHPVQQCGYLICPSGAINFYLKATIWYLNFCVRTRISEV